MKFEFGILGTIIGFWALFHISKVVEALNHLTNYLIHL